MDLGAILRRRPGVALVDELAHTNMPGSGPHEKRWQDVLDILGAGIDVITTVNIQHLESIADEVGQMTGAKVRWHQVQDDAPAEAIISFAREHQITQIVIGSIQHSWWHIPGGGPIVRQVIHEAGASGIDVNLIARREPPPAAAPGSSAANQS
jgi:K+-sensing histidine kinase KdpD